MMVSTFAQTQHTTARQTKMEALVEASIQSYGRELEMAIQTVEEKGVGPWNDDDLSELARAIKEIPRVVLKNPYALAVAWYVAYHRYATKQIDSISIALSNKRTLTGQDVKKYMLLFGSDKSEKDR